MSDVKQGGTAKGEYHLTPFHSLSHPTKQTVGSRTVGKFQAQSPRDIASGFGVDQRDSGLYVAKARVISAYATDAQGRLRVAQSDNLNDEGSVVCLSKAEINRMKRNEQ